MMKCEFEKLAGYEVTNEDYDNIIEPMYMSTNIDKAEFVKCIDKKRFALKTEKQYIKEMKSIAKHLKDTCERYEDYDAKDKFNGLVKEYKDRFFSHCNINYVSEYFYANIQRGCTYTKSVEMYTKDGHTIATIELVK